MWCIQKLNKYLTLMVLVVLLAPLQRVYAGSVTLGMELAYEKNRHKELAPVKSEGFRNSFKQNYLFFNSGSVVHRKILPYSAKFSYNKDNITNFDSSQKVVSKAFNFNSTILPVFRFPVTVSYRRTDRTTNILGGNRNQSQRVGLRWNLGFQKLPKTALFFNYREADEHGRKRDSSDYGFSLSKQAGGDVKYGRTTYFFAYRGKSSGRSRAVNDASSKAGQLTNSVSLSSATFFSKRSNFKQSLEYEIRESVRQENDEAFGPGNGSGSKVIRYSGGLGLETNPYLSQNYGFGYSFDSGPGRADALSTVFSGRIDKVVSNRLNLESSGQYSRDSTFLIRGGQVRSEGGRISTGARWKISQQLVSSYTLFARTAKTVSNEVGVDRESKAFGARTGVNFSDTFRFFTLRGGLTGSLSNDETDSTRSKVLSSQANTAVSSQALKIVSLSGNYSITNGKSSDLQQGNDIGSVSVTNVTRSESYGVSVSNIKYNKIVSLSGGVSISEDKSDSKLSGKSESYNAAASLSFIKNMTLTGSYSNNRRFTELTSDTTAESFKGKMGYVTSILRGPLAISSEYSSGKTSGKDITSISRESIQYRVGYSRLLTRFMAMSASYSHLDRKETNVADRIEDIWNLFLNCRFGAWTLSFETSLETREINRKTEVFRYVTRITRSISRRF